MADSVHICCVVPCVLMYSCSTVAASTSICPLLLVCFQYSSQAYKMRGQFVRLDLSVYDRTRKSGSPTGTASIVLLPCDQEGKKALTAHQASGYFRLTTHHPRSIHVLQWTHPPYDTRLLYSALVGHLRDDVLFPCRHNCLRCLI